MPCNATNPTYVAGARKLLRAGQLHRQAETALLRRLGKDPRDAGALLRLGDLRRRMGNFPAAAEAYSCLRALQPGERRASWLHAVTTGEQLPAAPPSGLRAAPFVHIRNFLSHAERERLLSASLAMRGRFRPGGVGLGADRKVRSLERRALEARLHACADPCTWLAPKLREALPEVSMLLRIDGLDRCSMVLTMAAHLDGGFGTRHRDFPSLQGILYFHREPKPFSGGDLLLYDTEVETGRYGAAEFSRVEPAADSIVFYPGHYVHEVTPVACGPGDFAAARLSVVVTFGLEAA